MGTQLPLPKKLAEPPPQFSAHVRCGETAGWIKMTLGMEVGLGPGHIALDARWGLRSPPKKGAEAPSPILCPILLWPHGWMHQDGTWYGDSPRHKRLVIDGDPATLPEKGGTGPNFWPMSIVAKRLAGLRCHLVRW